MSSIKCNYKCNEPLSKHTTLCIGGNADCFVEVETEEQLVSLLKFINENSIKFFVIGGGSNLLFSDEGFKGIVLKLSGEFCKYEISRNNVICGAAVSLAYLAIKTAEHGLSGLEYLSAIPGTVGGAVFGNAGVKNCSMSDIVDKIEVIDYSGNKRVLTKNNINFEYRKSDLQGNIITKIFFILKNADKNDILKTISQERKRRINSQPIGTKNAGCVFKNPESDSAGRLIDSLNLKNYSVGGIKISDVHANFFVNEDNGCAQDMLKLIDFVKDEVYKKYSIKLETEIKIIK
ncbi:UDP-N-acetylmuramate dehydrogenase [Candidatus Ruminimicrobiellum ovillum]|uniref:UDP-N-acetylmuramate dehydrogenase n=1 Tax=Candidatus Ruminimicrobiellum ovillum TaxID=1947927 RepID=UPI0035594297